MFKYVLTGFLLAAPIVYGAETSLSIEVEETATRKCAACAVVCTDVLETNDPIETNDMLIDIIKECLGSMDQADAARRLAHLYDDVFAKIGQDLSQLIKQYAGKFDDKQALGEYMGKVMTSAYTAIEDTEFENSVLFLALPKELNKELKQAAASYVQQFFTGNQLASITSIDQLAEYMNQWCLSYGTMLSDVLNKHYSDKKAENTDIVQAE